MARAYEALLRPLKAQRNAALPYAGLPIGTALSLCADVPLCFPRKEIKDYGTRSSVEGPHQAGERVVMIDDLATRGTSAIEALPKLRDAGLEVVDLIVLVDRDSGAGARLAAEGVRLHAVFTLTELLELWREAGKITPEQQAAARDFIAASA